MINNQTNRIIVICNSDIILKGLTEVLTGTTNEEVISLHQINELIDFPDLSGNILLVMQLSLFRENEGFLYHILAGITELKHLNLSYEEKPDLASRSISIHDNSATILGKVNEYLGYFGIPNEDRSAGELSRRETEVLRLLAKGLANKEVADKLSISVHTVISHRKNISEKIGIKSASGLTMYAILKKIIDIDEISTSDLI